MSREELIQGIVEDLARCQRPALDAGWKQLGLSHAQMSMLYLLFYHKQSSVKQIAEYLGISKSAVTQLMDPLVNEGLVQRQPYLKDRRIVHLSLTPDGLATIKKMAKYKFAGLRSRLESLSTAELDSLSSLCRKLSAETKKVKKGELNVS